MSLTSDRLRSSTMRQRCLCTRTIVSALGVLAFLIIPIPALAVPVFIDFESYNELDPVGTFDVATFTILGGSTSPLVLTAGSTVDETSFPPTSGVNLAADVDDFANNAGGPIRIVFAVPVLSFSGFFSYNTLLTITAFSDAAGTVLVDTQASSSVDNTGSSEELAVAFAGGIRSVLITGNPGGGSFTVDDIEFDKVSGVAPEPTTIVLFGTAAAVAIRRRLIRNTQVR